MKYIKRAAQLLVFSLFLTSVAFAQGNMQPQMQQQDIEPVTDKELEEFVVVAQEAQMINMETRSKIQKMVQDEGVSPKVFGEIVQLKMNPNADKSQLENYKEENVKKVEALLPELNKVQQESQQKTMKKVQDSDLTVQRFQQINMKLRNDKELQQRFQQVMQANQPKQPGMPQGNGQGQ